MHQIKLIILDVDGVMTDGGMYYTQTGNEFKRFNTKDGLAIQRLTQAGIEFGIISNGHLDVLISKRASHLGIQRVYVGKEKKLPILKSWCNELNIALQNVAMIGDDINDRDCLKVVGISACPQDAVQEIKKIATHVLTRNGGDACVREFLEIYFSDYLQ